MRTFVYDLKQVKHKKILKEFCTTDGFSMICLDELNEIPPVFFITDNKNAAAGFTLKIPVCLVTHAKESSNMFYTINDNFNVPVLRKFLDTAVHGSVLWNLTDSISSLNSYVEYEIKNNLHDVERVVCSATTDLFQQLPFNEVEKIRVGISEMVTNAIEHGNLAVTNEEKHAYTEEGSFDALIRERLKEARYRERRVFLSVKIGVGSLSVTVRDEGDGFDVNSLASDFDPEELLKLHGRGILISKAYFDKVEYNDKGNEVNLFRKF